jgi:hypothetical protein
MLPMQKQNALGQWADWYRALYLDTLATRGVRVEQLDRERLVARPALTARDVDALAALVHHHARACSPDNAGRWFAVIALVRQRGLRSPLLNELWSALVGVAMESGAAGRLPPAARNLGSGDKPPDKSADYLPDESPLDPKPLPDSWLKLALAERDVYAKQRGYDVRQGWNPAMIPRTLAGDVRTLAALWSARLATFRKRQPRALTSFDTTALTLWQTEASLVTLKLGDASVFTGNDSFWHALILLAAHLDAAGASSPSNLNQERLAAALYGTILKVGEKAAENAATDPLGAIGDGLAGFASDIGHYAHKAASKLEDLLGDGLWAIAKPFALVAGAGVAAYLVLRPRAPERTGAP